MTIELKKEIESELRRVYSRLGIQDDSVIERKIAGQFRCIASDGPKQVRLSDGHELIGKLLFIAQDQSDKNLTFVTRDGSLYSTATERWLVMIATEASTWLTIETLDVFWPNCFGDGRKTIRENGVWEQISVENLDEANAKWFVLY